MFDDIKKLERNIIKALKNHYTPTFKTESDIGMFCIRSVDDEINIVKNSTLYFSNNYGDGLNTVYIIKESDFQDLQDNFNNSLYFFERATIKDSIAIAYSDCVESSEVDNVTDFYYIFGPPRKKSFNMFTARIYTFEKTMLIVDCNI